MDKIIDRFFQWFTSLIRLGRGTGRKLVTIELNVEGYNDHLKIEMEFVPRRGDVFVYEDLKFKVTDVEFWLKKQKIKIFAEEVKPITYKEKFEQES